MASNALAASRPDPEVRTRRFLGDEPVIWLSTVREDGRPHLVPVWFWWDGEAVLVFSKPHAVKVRALRANPDAMLALGEPDDDFDVGMLEAHAELLDETPPVPDGFFAKYATKLAAGQLDPETFRATYTQAIRLVPTRWLAWHGRSARDVRQPVPTSRPAPAVRLHALPAFLRRALAPIGPLFQRPPSLPAGLHA
jgi:PPOX class probable F420-dependent enzyme